MRNKITNRVKYSNKTSIDSFKKSDSISENELDRNSLSNLNLNGSQLNSVDGKNSPSDLNQSPKQVDTLQNNNKDGEFVLSKDEESDSGYEDNYEEKEEEEKEHEIGSWEEYNNIGYEKKKKDEDYISPKLKFPNVQHLLQTGLSKPLDEDLIRVLDEERVLEHVQYDNRLFNMVRLLFI